MFWKVSSMVLLILLLITNVLWLKGALNAGVVSTHQKESFDNQTENVRALKVLLTEYSKGVGKKEILNFGNQSFPEGSILHKGDNIYIHNIKLTFENDKLVSIDYLY